MLVRNVAKGHVLAGLCALLVAGAVHAVPQRQGAGAQGVWPSGRIDGAATLDQAGKHVRGAGDVNGDGRPDLLVGAPGADNNGRTDSGSAYVVFGQRTGVRVDLASLGQSGFRIDGAAAGDSVLLAEPRFVYIPVAGAGDVNGDGLADVLVGTPGADANGRRDSGSVYAVFGKGSPENVDLASLGKSGFRIDGAAANDHLRYVAGGGDANGDGRPDLLVGASGVDLGERSDAGASYVIFGNASTRNVDLASLGEAGFRIDGAAGGGFAGDVNGDGLDDLLLGSRDSAHVVFGKATTENVDVSSLGQGGFRIGPHPDSLFGVLAAGAGDVNGDGRPDLLVGVPEADVGGKDAAGAAWVVFGKASTEDVDLGSLGQAGFRINGASAGDLTGDAVAGAGDVNGDDLADLLVAVPRLSTDSVAAYVILGKTGTDDVDLASLGRAGFGIPAPGDWAGIGIAGVGDVNGDGLADVLVGAPNASENGRAESGSAYLVFGFELETTPPVLTLSATSPQRLLRQKGLVAGVSCDEPCTLRATGTIAVPGQRMLLPLRAASAILDHPGLQVLELRLPSSVRKRLESLLVRGRRASARMSVRAIDRSGNASSATRTIGVRR